MDTCIKKDFKPVPFPIVAVAPYSLGARDPSLPYTKLPIGLCSAFTLTEYSCPPHQNANLKPVNEWNFDRADPHGIFADGTKWKPMSIMKCIIKCRITPNGTVYVGDGPHGLVV